MAAAGDWRAPLRHVREVLRTAPLCTLEAAQAELKAILAEVAARCGKNLDEAEMEAASLQFKNVSISVALLAVVTPCQCRRLPSCTIWS